MITNEGSQDGVEIQHNRIVYNAGGGLSNADPDADVDARDNWWGCNTGPGPNPSCAGCGPDPDPTCDEVAHPGAGSTPSFTPWMTMSFTATPSVANAGDRSTLALVAGPPQRRSHAGGPVLPDRRGRVRLHAARHAHATRRARSTPADVSASSAYQAGAEDPDELRSTIDRQTLRIKILRPPDSDVVPYVVPDDDTLTPGPGRRSRGADHQRRQPARSARCGRACGWTRSSTADRPVPDRPPAGPGRGDLPPDPPARAARRLRRTRHAPPAGHGQRSPGAHRPRDGSRARRAVRQRALPDGANRLDAPAPARDRSDRVLTCARCSS